MWAYLDLRDAATACRLALSPAEPGCHVLFVAAEQTLAPYPTGSCSTPTIPDPSAGPIFAGRDVPIALDPARRIDRIHRPVSACAVP